MPPLRDKRRGPDLYRIGRHELSPADEVSIGLAITNANANERLGLFRRTSQSFPLQSENFWFVFPERPMINSNPTGDRNAIA